jgi:hypothetical protein
MKKKERWGDPTDINNKIAPKREREQREKSSKGPQFFVGPPPILFPSITTTISRWAAPKRNLRRKRKKKKVIIKGI